MKIYTVLLLRPDYVADNFGQDTYMTHVEATSVPDAELKAQLEAAKTDYVEDEYTFEEAVKADEVNFNDIVAYYVLAVIEGKHMDIKTS